MRLEGSDAVLGGWTLTGYRSVCLTGVVANLLACAVTFTVREIKVSGVAATLPDDDVTAFAPSRASPRDICRDICRTRTFWQYLVVCVVTINVRMIFRHLDATLPKFMMREFGEGVAKGSIYAINPALIILLVPLITAATSSVDPLVMIHYGTYVSAASVFFLAFSTSMWACVMFVITLSVGEAIWSPRLYEYTISVATEGREGTYVALSSAPLFLVKLPVGMMSGYLLQKYCPEEGPRDSQKMWLIIGCVTALSPVLMTLLWKFISKKHDENDKEDNDELNGLLLNEFTSRKSHSELS